jgi:tripartite-type tricarboxylate transporter receptor subunit TctC
MGPCSDVVRTLSSQGAEPVGNTPDEFAAFVKSEIEKWAKVVKLTKMKPD